MIRNLWSIWVTFFEVFFCSMIRINHFLYSFIVLLHLISPSSFTRAFVATYAYVSMESIDWILLSSFELNVILLLSSVKTLCLSLLNSCCFFINLLFFYGLFMFSFMTKETIWFNFFSRWFIIFSSWVASK